MRNPAGFFCPEGICMQYSKPALSFEEQADQLLGRGLVADRDEIITRLQAVNYYRLSGYLYPFRNSNDTYQKGTTLTEVWRRYTFDRRLRMLMLDAIERIEVAVRTRLAYSFSHQHGPFGYLDSRNLPGLMHEYDKWRESLSEEYKRSRETFVQHFRDKYGDSHGDIPLWMAVELMAFGTMLRMYGGVAAHIQREVAAVFGYPDRVFYSWLMALNGVRNICAHHQRLWNRELGLKPFIPREHKYPEWHMPVSIGNNRIFSIVTLAKCLMSKIDPKSSWPERFVDLLSKYSEIPLSPMGIPERWRESPLWCDVA